MFKKFSQQKGVTLVELLIVLALISMVLGLIFTIFSISNKAFYGGTEQGYMQKGARIAAQLITKQLRNAKEVSIEPITSESKYYTIKLEKNSDNALYHVVLETIQEGIAVKKTSFGEEYKKISFMGDDSPGVLNFTLEFEEYTLSSAIKLNNINQRIIPKGTSKNTIYFSKYE
ncbi:prepilin-type N-terminal cleavage/methylation domain-containing protein [Irregularibacter muris]|uniref:Prepilin-type N-terminal cleavage/methylation domain-containing protein n=1 Tax=Irregularibacter muris TaxID=1796619 RepID=A0AAE3L231_9FIRM|nr:prepilin-type N-terminal cleavage/methylation domain-containing protein [Irregularibacter muris]MCR1897884.1 prepilin-type N-terminal cleavage/methylation domain-containing protein [Irregularibacter muris]